MSEAIRNRDRFLGIELRHLAALEAVVDTGSFAEAGRRLGYSQSAISQQIAALERATGMRLLDRPVGRRVVSITDAGERLLRHARRAVAALRAAEADLTALADGQAGTIRVGTFQSAGERLLPRVMRRYVERRPQVQVRLTERAYDEELVVQLDRGELDLAFVQGPVAPGLAAVDVLTDPFVLLAPAADALASHARPLRVRDLARLPLIGYRRPEEGGEAFLRSRGLEPDVVFRSDESGTVQGLVGAGIGYALVPLLAVDQADPDVAVLDVEGVLPREIVLAWHADRTLTPAAAAFVDVAEEVADELRAAAPGA